MKVNVEHFDYNNILRDFKFMKSAGKIVEKKLFIISFYEYFLFSCYFIKRSSLFLTPEEGYNNQNVKHRLS